MKELVLLQHMQLDKRTTWQELCSKTGFTHRMVQKCIETLRKQGVHISSSDSELGYKYASNEKEINDITNVYKSRIRTHINTLIAQSSEDDVIAWLLDDVINKTKYTG